MGPNTMDAQVPLLVIAINFILPTNLFDKSIYNPLNMKIVLIQGMNHDFKIKGENGETLLTEK